MHRRLSRGETITIYPLYAHLARRAVLAIVLATVPPFAALYALSATTHRWPVVLVANIALVALTYAAVARMRATSITLTREGIREVGYLGRVTWTPAAELAAVRAIEVNSSRTLTSYPNVFFLDGRGRTRVRLRGEFWGRKALEAVLTAYDVPVERVSEPISRTELRHRFRSNLYSWERHPVLAYVVGAGLLLVTAAPTLAALQRLV